jgi:hypothetical protein
MHVSEQWPDITRVPEPQLIMAPDYLHRIMGEAFVIMSNPHFS